MDSKVIFTHNRGFGDTIWIEPIVRHFLALGHEVDLFCPYPDVFLHYPSSHLRINPQEALFPVHPNSIFLSFGKLPHMHLLEAYRLQSGIAQMELSVPKVYLSSQEKIRRINNDYAIIHLDNYRKEFYRNTYDIDWKKIIQYIQSLGIQPIQISGKSTAIPVAPYIPTHDFRDIMSLMHHAQLFIGLDSGPSHIATCMNIPSVIFFGSVNPMYRHLDTINKVFLQSPCPVFAHCYHELSDGGQGLGKPCRIVGREHKPPCCTYDTQTVVDAIESLLKKN